jgi:hypothetical protein
VGDDNAGEISNLIDSLFKHNALSPEVGTPPVFHKDTVETDRRRLLVIPTAFMMTEGGWLFPGLVCFFCWLSDEVADKLPTVHSLVLAGEAKRRM